VSEKLREVILQLLLERIAQNQVVKRGALDRVKQFFVLLEVTILKHEYLAAHFTRPLANGVVEFFGDLRRSATTTGDGSE
jgi:hypothetical protein